MAAILCKGLGQVCEAVGEVICLPCQACGFGCKQLGGLCTSPFTPYLLLTACLNIPPALLGISGSQDDMCGSSLKRWFLVNAALALVHIVAAVYIVHQIREDQQEDGVIQTGAPVVTGTTVDDENTKVESGTYYQSTALPAGRQNSMAIDVGTDVPSEATTAQNSFARMKQVLCHDPGVAIYILLVVWWCIWQTIGVSEALKDNYCDESSKVVYSLMCGFLYMSLAGVGFGCSLCCLR